MAKKILVVDDEPDIVETVRLRLEANGYEVIGAYNGKDCVIKAQQQRPDLIILDILMPDIDGGAVAEKLKANPGTDKIPIIFLTGLIKGEEIGKREEIGDNIFIAKPFNPGDLLIKVRKLLGDE